MPHVFHAPPTLVLGGGSRHEAAQHLRRLGCRRPLVVTDAGVVRLGAVDELTARLRDAGFDPLVFAEVQADPTDRNVADGLALLRANQCDSLVALGGGSPIDTAKAIGVLATNSEPLAQYAGYHLIPRPGLPLVAIPTTAGTGSEATKVTVITDTARDVKMMILSAHLTPTVALVDFELTLTMPASLTAAVGVDTLTHGIEAYVSRKANGLADAMALACVELCGRHLRTACVAPQDRAAREGMMLAACQGGLAFANASVCLVHGMSRPIGALFHVPHGLSNAILLPTVVRYSWRAAIERYARVARILGCAPADSTDADAAGSLADGLARLNVELGLPPTSRCPGIDRERFFASLPRMAEAALASGSPQNNPRVPTADEIVELYRAAWEDGR